MYGRQDHLITGYNANWRSRVTRKTLRKVKAVRLLYWQLETKVIALRVQFTQTAREKSGYNICVNCETFREEPKTPMTHSNIMSSNDLPANALFDYLLSHNSSKFYRQNGLGTGRSRTGLRLQVAAGRVSVIWSTQSDFELHTARYIIGIGEPLTKD